MKQIGNSAKDENMMIFSESNAQTKRTVPLVCKLFFLLMIFLCISCGNNKISIRVESALISSSDNQPLRSLTLENDSLLFTYQISLKDGYVGLSSINLNRINDAYVITYGIECQVCAHNSIQFFG